MRTTTAVALLALHATSALAWNSTCKEGVGPCMGPEVVALESSDCDEYHIFLARGSDSAYPGHQGNLVKLICDGLGDDCGYENIIYPANSSFAGEGMWCKSAGIGATNGQAQLRAYAEKCPESKLIVSGFSQGASVMLDILGGGGGPGFHCWDQPFNGPLSRSEVPGSNIVAAVVFGAVVRSKGQNYTVQTSSKMDFHGQNPADFDGQHARSDDSLAALSEYSNILRDYCNVGDGVCAVGSEPESLQNHLNYFDLYNQEAADWVVKVASGKKAKVSSTSSKASSTKMSSTKASFTKTASATPTTTHAHETGDKHSAKATGVADNVKEEPTQTPSKGNTVSAPWGVSVAGFAVVVGALFRLV